MDHDFLVSAQAATTAFERDFTFALNMLLGKSPEQAEVDADQWVKDAREEPPKTTSVRRIYRNTLPK